MAKTIPENMQSKGIIDIELLAMLEGLNNFKKLFRMWMLPF